jgi:hypothetical protein
VGVILIRIYFIPVFTLKRKRTQRRVVDANDTLSEIDRDIHPTETLKGLQSCNRYMLLPVDLDVQEPMDFTAVY